MSNIPANESQEGVKRLFYVPVSINMIWTATQDVDECKIDDFDVKSVVIVGRVVQRVCKEPDQIHYLINDNTGTITVIDYKGSFPDYFGHREYEFKWYGYVKIHGVILARKDKYQISLDTIKVVDDPNEITNHFLHVVMSKVARKFGVQAIEPPKSSVKPHN